MVYLHREVEELKLNTVTIKIYPQSEYVFEDNHIHAKSGKRVKADTPDVGLL